MKEFFTEWYQAIFIRRSRRTYLQKPLPTEIINLLSNFCENINQYLPGCRLVLITQGIEKVFKGIIGAYGRIINAPAYVAFIADLANPQHLEKTGYLGEALILHATNMGLATCWVGGFFDQNLVNSQVKINKNERVLAITAVGYAGEKYSAAEKIISQLASGHKRKSLNVLCQPYTPHSWPEWINCSLLAAQLAPSAMNRQPWRFKVKQNSITVSSTTLLAPIGISARLDCGIAMLHLELGAYHQGVSGSWVYLKHPQVAVFEST